MATRLFDSVIVGFDGSEQAQDALALGRLLGSLGSSGIVLAYITDQSAAVRAAESRVRAGSPREGPRGAGAGAVRCSPDHDRVEPASIDSSSAARGLHDLASEYGNYGSSVLVIGSTHRGPIGRVSARQRRRAARIGCPCPITVAPRGFAQHAPAVDREVAVGFDGSRGVTGSACARPSDLALAADAKLHAVAVAIVRRSEVGTRRAPVHDREALQARLDEALGELGGTADGTVLDGDPAERLAEAAAECRHARARRAGLRAPPPRARGKRVLEADALGAVPGARPAAAGADGRSPDEAKCRP